MELEVKGGQDPDEQPAPAPESPKWRFPPRTPHRPGCHPALGGWSVHGPGPSRGEEVDAEESRPALSVQVSLGPSPTSQPAAVPSAHCAARVPTEPSHPTEPLTVVAPLRGLGSA